MRVLVGGLLVLLVFTGGKAQDSAMRSSSEGEIDEYDESEEEDVGVLRPPKPKAADVLIVCNKDANDPCTCKDETPISLICKWKDLTRSLNTTNIAPKDNNFRPTFVSFYGNRIEYIEAATLLPGQEGNVEALDFMSNHVQDIHEKAFDKFSKLKKLRLTNNLINLRKETDGWITDQLGNTLEKLYLGFNKIERLNDDVFAPLHKLKTLALDGNPGIELTVNTFATGLDKLEKLSLDHCHLKSLPEKVFSGLKNLKFLSLIGNPLNNVPKALNLVNNLEILDLSRTELTEFTRGALKEDHKVKKLFLQQMDFLYALDDCAFCGLKQLERLDLSGSKKLHIINENAFGNVKSDAGRPGNLKILKLEKCSISTLPEKLVPWAKLSEIGIWGNPLNCDDKLYWLLKDPNLYKLNASVGAQEPICDLPNQVSGFSIRNASQVLGKPQTSARLTFSVFRVFVVLTTMVGLVVFGLVARNRRLNPFYRPQMPHLGFNNLSTQLDDEADDEFEDPLPVAV